MSKLEFLQSVGVMIVIVLIFLGIGIALDTLRHYAHGFTMTPELEQEWRVLQICIETDIQLEFCDTRYGGIGKPYGEPVR